MHDTKIFLHNYTYMKALFTLVLSNLLKSDLLSDKFVIGLY